MLFKYLVTFFSLSALASAAAVPEAAVVPEAAAAELLEARAVNGHCSGTASGTYLTYGICITTSTCNSYSGSYISGGCPNDPNNVRCCVIGLADSVATNPCGGASWCGWTSLTCSGTRRQGKKIAQNYRIAC